MDRLASVAAAALVLLGAACSRPPAERLRAAAARGDAAALEAILRGPSIDVDVPDAQGRTALMLAAGSGDPLAVGLLLQDGANPSAADRSGMTALHYAAAAGKTDVVKALVTHGANLEAKDSRGWTPLIAAAENGRTETCLALLEKGAHLHDKNTRGEDALMAIQVKAGRAAARELEAAAAKKPAERAGVLAARPKDVALPARGLGSRPVDAPAAGDSRRSPARLSGGPDPDALVEAAGKGDLTALSSLLERGAAVEGTSRAPSPGLMTVALKDRPDLASTSPAPEATDARGQTALMAASAGGKAKAVALLLDKGARVASRDGLGQTPLMYAVAKGHADVAKLLLSRGAPPDQADARGWTPLMFAAAKGEKDVVDLLLGAGARPDAAAVDGRTALMIAAAKGCASVAEALLAKGSWIETKDAAGVSALMYAVSGGHADVVKILVDHEAHLEAHTPQGLTVLMVAARSGREDIVKILLASRRTKVNAKTAQGQTALMYAAAGGHAGVVGALLAAGADPALTDDSGLTALQIAQAKGQKDVARLLTR